MPKTKDVIAGLQLLQSYRERELWDISAEHDTIYAHATDRPLSFEDIRKMIDLGWYQDRGGDEFTPEDYDAEESWYCYV